MTSRPTKCTARITAIDALTPEIKRFTLALSEPITFRHGQFVNLRFPGETRYHAFSIASSDQHPETIELIIKLHGEFTKHLFTSSTGMELECLAPLGNFTDESRMEGDVVMIAGGVGVTPLLGLLRSMRDGDRHDRTYWLFYSCRTRDAIIAEQELRDACARNPNLKVVFTLTREQPDAWDGEYGHVDEAMLHRHLGGLDGKTYYLCGPTRMVDAMRATLEQAGIPKERIRTESWG